MFDEGPGVGASRGILVLKGEGIAGDVEEARLVVGRGVIPRVVSVPLDPENRTACLLLVLVVGPEAAGDAATEDSGDFSDGPTPRNEAMLEAGEGR